jgi:hypothetical protein
MIPPIRSMPGPPGGDALSEVTVSGGSSWPPLSPTELRAIAEFQLEEAKTLLREGRHTIAVYLCGISIEAALKARICKTLGWAEYKAAEGYESFGTNDLEVLLDLSGVRPMVIPQYLAEWSAVHFRGCEHRNQPTFQADPRLATDMVAAAQILIEIL